MPEIVEVETARSVIEKHALDRRIERVDDQDSYVCRPHLAGEIASALLKRSFVAAHRIGKSMWLELSGPDSPTLGLHLGMSGRIVVDGFVGGDPRFDGLDNLDSIWTRFRVDFADGGYLLLFDKRRLGRVQLNPDLSKLGPDALAITPEAFRSRVGRSDAPIKARLLNQNVIAGIGNLLADQLLWEAKINPARSSSTLTKSELTRLHTTLLSCTNDAMQKGGVHTGSLIPHRTAGGVCPRCGAALLRSKVGGRTTWRCSREQG